MVHVGQILKLHNAYCAVVLEVFESEPGGTVLRVQTLRNVFRGFGPELIEASRFPDGLVPGTLADIEREIAEHEQRVAAGLAKMLAAVAPSPQTW